MSEEVETTPVQPAEILPAKSEDKLIIEKEEQESEVQEQKTEDKSEEKTEVKENKDTEEEKTDKIEDAKEVDDDKKDTPVEEKENGGKEGDEDAKGARSRKKFKLPNVEIKAPKVPGFIRALSKERKKNKDKEGDEENADEDAAKGEEGAVEATGEEGDITKDTEEVEESPKDTKTKVKEAIENIHLPKLPKMHKPAFLKKKKEAAVEGEEAPENNKETDGEGDEEKETKDDKKDEDGEEENKEKKSSKIMDSIKNIKSQVHVPAFLSKKSSSKEKDAEAGDKEESKELLEKKEGDSEKGGDETKEKTDTEDTEQKPGEEETKEVDQTDCKPATSRGAALLESIRSAASHVPAIFRKPKDKETDVEAGEKDELLDKQDDSNKKEDVEGDELKEVKADDGSSPIKKDPDAASHDSEKKDPEKGGEEGEGGEKKVLPLQQHLDRAKEVGDRCRQRFDALDSDKKKLVIALLGLLFLIIIIIIISVAATPSGWSNESRIVSGGKYVETHTTCGPVQGLVEGPDQFSFKRIPYASPVLNKDRWSYSKPKTSLEDCHSGLLKAHSHNDSLGDSLCLRKFGGVDGGSGDTEDCLTLDIFTSSVVYDQLMPVVVYVDGDELNEERTKEIRPTAELAKKHGVVFINVNYRLGVFGFLSLNSLSARTYPKTSGNYGLGDIISALEWLQLNIKHFGGHPSQITILGRSSGATMVTALTASLKAKGLFKQAWITNGAGVIQGKGLSQANKDNKRILETLNCGSDEVNCLIDSLEEDLLNAVPNDWLNTRMSKLPRKNPVVEKGHSWVIVDKNILMDTPMNYWKENKGSNNVPIVIGATAQGAVSEENKNLEPGGWNKDSLGRRVETALGSFNTTIPEQAIKRYNEYLDGLPVDKLVNKYWLAYASMISDIKTICPLQDLATSLSEQFSAKVYSYVATQRRNRLDNIADGTSDIEAIFDMYQIDDDYQKLADNEDSANAEMNREELIAGAKVAAEQTAFVENIQDMFYTFVRTGTLPQGKDMSQGMYTINAEITTQRNYPNCDFWKNTRNIVPTYANLD